MLQATKMVRRAIESQYDGVCTVCEHTKVKKSNGSTGFSDVVAFENVPCRLSYAKIKPTTQISGAFALMQSIKVFLAPEIPIKPGSKMSITQNGRTIDYKNTGKPAIYESHQEINLELFEGWA